MVPKLHPGSKQRCLGDWLISGDCAYIYLFQGRKLRPLQGAQPCLKDCHFMDLSHWGPFYPGSTLCHLHFSLSLLLKPQGRNHSLNFMYSYFYFGCNTVAVRKCVKAMVLVQKPLWLLTHLRLSSSVLVTTGSESQSPCGCRGWQGSHQGRVLGLRGALESLWFLLYSEKTEPRGREMFCLRPCTILLEEVL